MRQGALERQRYPIRAILVGKDIWQPLHPRHPEEQLGDIGMGQLKYEAQAVRGVTNVGDQHPKSIQSPQHCV